MAGPTAVDSHVGFQIDPSQLSSSGEVSQVDTSPEASVLDRARAAAHDVDEPSTQPTLTPGSSTDNGTARPLSGSLAEFADRVDDIVRSDWRFGDKIDALMALRQDASPEQASYVDRMGASILLMPIGKAGADMDLDFIMGMAELPHRLMNSNDFTSLRSELSMFEGRLQETGRLTDDAADAFANLNKIVDAKEAGAREIGTAREGLEAFKNEAQDAPALTSLIETATGFPEHFEEIAADKGASFAESLSQNLKNDATDLASDVFAASAETADAIRDQLPNVLDAIRDAHGEADDLLLPLFEREAALLEPDRAAVDGFMLDFGIDRAASAEARETISSQFEGVSHHIESGENSLRSIDGEIDGLYQQLEEAGNKLLPHDRHELEESLAVLLTTADTLIERFDAEKASVGRDINKATVNIDLVETAQMHEAIGMLNALRDKTNVGNTDALKMIDDAIASVEKKINQRHSDAVVNARLSYDAVLDARERESVETVITKLGKTRNEIVSDPNLTQDEKNSWTGKLDNLLRDIAADPVRDAIAAVDSSSLDAPSIVSVMKQIDGTEHLTDSDKTELKAKLAESSHAILEHYDAQLSALESSFDSMNLDDLRNTDLSPFNDADTKLTADDSDAFANHYKKAMEHLEDALFARVMAGDHVSSLGEEEKTGLRLMLRESAYHPSVVNALNDGQLSTELLSALSHDPREQGTKEPLALDAKIVDGLDQLVTNHPELDASVLNMKRALSNNNPDVELAHLSTGVRRELMASLKLQCSASVLKSLGVEGNVISVESLETLVKSIDTTKNLQAIDLQIAGALWAARKAEGMSFEDFSAVLPQNLRSRDNLRTFLENNLTSLRQVDTMTNTVECVTKAFGRREDMLEICQRLVQSEDRYAAAQALTSMARKYLGGASMTGSQAMEGGASALGLAVAKERNNSNAMSRLLNKALVSLKLKDKDALLQGDDQMLAFAMGADDLKAELKDLEAKEAQLYFAQEALTHYDKRRKTMVDRLQSYRPDDKDKIESLRDPSSRTYEVTGGELAMTILALQTVLTDSHYTADSNGKPSSNRLFKMQKALKGLDIQGQISLSMMCGHSTASKGLDKDYNHPEDKAFAKAVDDFIDKPTEEGRQRILDTIEEKGLLERAETVLFFKEFDDPSGTKAVSRKMDQIYTTLGRDKEEFAWLEKNLQKKYSQIIGLAQRQDSMVGLAQEALIANKNQMEDAIKRVEKHFSGQVLQSIQNAVDLAVCQSFLEYKGAQTAEALIKERPVVGIKNWSFYDVVMKNTAKLKLPAEVAEPIVAKTLKNLNKDTFRQMSSSKAEAFKNRAQRLASAELRSNVQMADLVKVGEFERLSGEIVKALDEPGSAMAFDTQASAGVAVPVFESEVASVEAKIDLTMRRGMTVWKDRENQYHCSMMHGGEAGLGVSVSAFEEAVSANAGVGGSHVRGFDLVFPDKTSCCKLVAQVLSGHGREVDFEGCSKMATFTETGLSAYADVTLEKEISGAAAVVTQDIMDGEASVKNDPKGTLERATGEGKITLGAELSGNISWKTVESGNVVAKETSVSGSFSLSMKSESKPAEETENAVENESESEDASKTEEAEKTDSSAPTDEAEKTEEAGEAKEADGEKDDGSKESERHYSLNYSEKISIKNSRTGLFVGASAKRIYIVSNSQEASATLSQLGVSKKCQSDIAALIDELDGRITLEVEREVPKSTVDRLVATSGKLENTDYRPTLVNVVSEGATVASAKKLSLKFLTLQQAQSASNRRTFSFNPKY